MAPGRQSDVLNPRSMQYQPNLFRNPPQLRGTTTFSFLLPRCWGGSSGSTGPLCERSGVSTSQDYDSVRVPPSLSRFHLQPANPLPSNLSPGRMTRDSIQPTVVQSRHLSNQGERFNPACHAKTVFLITVVFQVDLTAP